MAFTRCSSTTATRPGAGDCLLCRYVAMSLCLYVGMSLCRCVAVSLCRCVAVSLAATHRCAVLSVCVCDGFLVSACPTLEGSARLWTSPPSTLETTHASAWMMMDSLRETRTRRQRCLMVSRHCVTWWWASTVVFDASPCRRHAGQTLCPNCRCLTATIKQYGGPQSSGAGHSRGRCVVANCVSPTQLQVVHPPVPSHASHTPYTPCSSCFPPRARPASLSTAPVCAPHDVAAHACVL